MSLEHSLEQAQLPMAYSLANLANRWPIISYGEQDGRRDSKCQIAKPKCRRTSWQTTCLKVTECLKLSVKTACNNLPLLRITLRLYDGSAVSFTNLGERVHAKTLDLLRHPAKARGDLSAAHSSRAQADPRGDLHIWQTAKHIWQTWKTRTVKEKQKISLWARSMSRNNIVA